MIKGEITYEKTNTTDGFTLNSVAPHSPGLWRHPKDQGHRHGDLDYWTELAKLLEIGCIWRQLGSCD